MSDRVIPHCHVRAWRYYYWYTLKLASVSDGNVNSDRKSLAPLQAEQALRYHWVKYFIQCRLSHFLSLCLLSAILLIFIHAFPQILIRVVEVVQIVESCLGSKHAEQLKQPTLCAPSLITAVVLNSSVSGLIWSVKAEISRQIRGQADNAYFLRWENAGSVVMPTRSVRIPPANGLLSLMLAI